MLPVYISLSQQRETQGGRQSGAEEKERGKERKMKALTARLA